MKQTVEVAIEYAGSVISSFGTNGVPNGISAIKKINHLYHIHFLLHFLQSFLFA